MVQDLSLTGFPLSTYMTVTKRYQFTRLSTLESSACAFHKQGLAWVHHIDVFFSLHQQRYNFQRQKHLDEFLTHKPFLAIPVWV